MKKRAFWLGLLLLSSQLATGCCGYYGGWCCHRPYPLRPWLSARVSTCEGCGGGSAATAPPMDYGIPPIAPSGPGMPKSVDLSRR